MQSKNKKQKNEFLKSTADVCTAGDNWFQSSSSARAYRSALEMLISFIFNYTFTNMVDLIKICGLSLCVKLKVRFKYS
jgi:hypothetical protein